MRVAAIPTRSPSGGTAHPGKPSNDAPSADAPPDETHPVGARADLAGLHPIGAISERSGVPVTTLRYYEKVGLLQPTRRVGNQRRYDESAIGRLEVIGLCKRAGFSLEEIALLYDDRSPGRAASRELARRKLEQIDRQLEELHQARAVVEWGLKCTCPRLDSCSCGTHPPGTDVFPAERTVESAVS